MAKPARKPISETIQAQVLVESRRRCAMCFHLDEDLSVKDGQLAHIDRDRGNGAESNLVFLCLIHHNQYDARPSQAKGWLPAELTDIKRRFLQAIAEGRHVVSLMAVAAHGREADRVMFAELVQMMTQSRTADFFAADLLRQRVLSLATAERHRELRDILGWRRARVHRPGYGGAAADIHC